MKNMKKRNPSRTLLLTTQTIKSLVRSELDVANGGTRCPGGPSSPIECGKCYHVTDGCAGRPLIIAGEARVAEIEERDDWDC